jgi:hypothetical protein
MYLAQGKVINKPLTNIYKALRFFFLDLLEPRIFFGVLLHEYGGTMPNQRSTIEQLGRTLRAVNADILNADLPLHMQILLLRLASREAAQDIPHSGFAASKFPRSRLAT